MGLLPLLYQDPVTFVILTVLLLYSVIFHETAHGWTALLFGDDTAKRSGRLTLAPGPHLSPLGALMLLVVGFGWAKPVPVNFDRLVPRRLGFFCVSLAGCAVNIILAACAIFLLQLESVRAVPVFARALPVFAMINIMLGALNLLPIPPLDGSKVLMSFLPEELQRSLARIEPYGFFILILLIVTGILRPVIFFMQELLLALIVLTFKIFTLG